MAWHGMECSRRGAVNDKEGTERVARQWKRELDFQGHYSPRLSMLLATLLGNLPEVSCRAVPIHLYSDSGLQMHGIHFHPDS